MNNDSFLGSSKLYLSISMVQNKWFPICWVLEAIFPSRTAPPKLLLQMMINHTWSTAEKWIGIRWEEATSRSHLRQSACKPEWRGGRNASVRAWREHKSRKHAISSLNHGSMQSVNDGKHKSRTEACNSRIWGVSEINGQATSNRTGITWSDGKPESASDS
jgi:hypothetical protein